MKNFDLNSFRSSSLLKTNKGGVKDSIYKKEIFDGVENKKAMRTKLRKLMYNYCASILQITETSKQKDLAKDFANFYKSVYRLNDYTLLSIASPNTEESKKDTLSKGIEKFAKLLK